MTQQSPIRYRPGTADAGAQLAQLRDALGLVEQIAGLNPGGDAGLEQSARIGSAYGAAEPIARKRFDALAAETSEWAAVAVEALLQCDDERAAKAAAAALAKELSQALGQLDNIIGNAAVRETSAPSPVAGKLPSWMVG